MSGEDFSSWLISIRRKLHQIPEPGFEEFETARFIKRTLDELSISYKDGIAKTGIIAQIGDKGPCVAIRADMDALRIEEQTGLPFSSRHKGFMHACGHDGHMAMLLGAGALLKEEESDLPGRVKLIFQPAEEGLGGAQQMIQEGALEEVSFIFGGHIDRNYKVGEMVVQEGLICAFADTFRLDLYGRDGHAARPFEAIDCIVAASHLICAIQSFVTRQLNPLYPTVISIGQVKAGTAPNVIAGHASLKGTVRTTHSETREKVLSSFEQLVDSISASFNVYSMLEFYDCYPPVINDRKATKIALEAAQSTKKIGRIVQDMPPSLGGEDFSFYLKEVPGCFVRLGAQKKGIETIPAHSSMFDFDERVLTIGAYFYKNLAKTALRHLHTK